MDKGTASSKLINKLASALGATRYLEVGVEKGRTLQDVAIASKTGVDPNFRFSLDDEAFSECMLVSSTSDEYFASIAGTNVVFDVVFLDGLHTFEQTYKDFIHTLPHSHARTVWLIDDTYPRDLFGGERSNRRAQELRDRFGFKRGGWNGDVYKLVYALDAFHPSFDFVTVSPPHKTQTLVWQGRRGPSLSGIQTYRAIEEMTWLEGSDKPEVFRPGSPGDAVEACLRVLVPGGDIEP